MHAEEALERTEALIIFFSIEKIFSCVWVRTLATSVADKCFIHCTMPLRQLAGPLFGIFSNFKMEIHLLE